METIKRLSRDLMELEMEDYVKSSKYEEEQESILGLMNKLKETLNSEQRVMLLELMDAINRADSRFAFEAFFMGLKFLREHPQ